MNENGSHNRRKIPEKLRLAAEGPLIFARQGRSTKDRYKVTSLSGYPITPDMHTRDTNVKWTTEWYVVDKLVNYEVVATFAHKNAQKLARALCYELNCDERQWEAEHGVR